MLCADLPPLNSTQNQMFIPSDICFMIMQFLNLKQIISTCSLISKNWLFESLKIKLQLLDCPDVQLRRLFNSSKSSLNNSSRLQNISHLMIKVSNSDDGRMALTELIEHLHQMKSLKMLGLPGETSKLQIQTEIAKLLKCQELEHLTVLKIGRGYNFSTSQAIASCSYLRNLRELEIISFNRLDSKVISTIALSCYLKNLRIFNFRIDFGNSTANDCKIISENLKELESFVLVDPEIDCLKYISTMRKLKKLEIWSGRICLDDLNVESMSNLESVRFDGSGFNRSNVKILGNNFHNLSSINFSIHDDSNLTDDYISQLFTENIRVLSLKRIRKYSLNSLMKLIAQKLRNLKELTIGDVKDEDIKSFVDHLDYQSPLQGLYLYGSEISDKGIEYLSLNSKNLNQIDYISIRPVRQHYQDTILDHLALSSFSNVLIAFSYSLPDEKIEKRINYWKSMNKLMNLDQNCSRIYFDNRTW